MHSYKEGIAGLYIALRLVLSKYLFKVKKGDILHGYNEGIAGLYIGLCLVLNKYLFKVKKGDILYGYNEGIAGLYIPGITPFVLIKIQFFLVLVQG